MWDNLPFFPEQASTVAAEVDALYLFLVGVSTFFSLLIFSLVFFFAVKYRRRSEDELPRPIVGSIALETLWSVIPFVLALVNLTGRPTGTCSWLISRGPVIC